MLCIIEIVVTFTCAADRVKSLSGFRSWSFCKCHQQHTSPTQCDKESRWNPTVASISPSSMARPRLNWRTGRRRWRRTPSRCPPTPCPAPSRPRPAPGGPPSPRVHVPRPAPEGEFRGRCEANETEGGWPRVTFGGRAGVRYGWIGRSTGAHCTALSCSFPYTVRQSQSL